MFGRKQEAHKLLHGYRQHDVHVQGQAKVCHVSLELTGRRARGPVPLGSGYYAENEPEDGTYQVGYCQAKDEPKGRPSKSLHAAEGKHNEGVDGNGDYQDDDKNQGDDNLFATSHLARKNSSVYDTFANLTSFLHEKDRSALASI